MLCRIDLGQMLPEVHLFHSCKKANKFLRGIGVDCEVDAGMDASTTYLRNGSRLLAVVVIRAKSDRVSEESLLVHEAVHVVMETIDALGFDPRDQEVVAYMVQSVAYGLIRAHTACTSRAQG